MKKSKLLLYIFFAFISFSSFNNEAKAQNVNVDFNLFYNNLSPYGRWIDNPRYGHVWLYSEAGFRPYYTNGHWDYTDYGWTWVSDYDWGWAPFHYGRWEYDPMYGWMWIPGYDWAPAWVAWGEYGNDYGWAPLGYGMNLGMGISFGSIPYNRWVFGPREYINSPGFYNYYSVPNRRFGNNVTIINNYNQYRGGRYMSGPDRYEVERYTRTQIQPRRYDNNYFGNRNDVFRQDRGNNNIGRDNGWSRRGDEAAPQNNNRVFDQQRNSQGWQNRSEQSNAGYPQRQNSTRNGNPFGQQPQAAPNVPRQQTVPQQRPVMEQRNNQQGGWGNRGGFERQQSQPRNFGASENRQSTNSNNNGNGGGRSSEGQHGGGGWGRRGG